MNAFIKKQLQNINKKHLHRAVYSLETPQGPEIRIEQKNYLSFCSNDYLGLANDPDILDAIKAGVDQFGLGSGASHLVSGHSIAHDELEARLAEFTGRPRALLFSSGYLANLAVITTLCQRHDTLFMDRLNHASLIDGARLSSARLQRYHHRDSKHLREIMEHHNHARLIISDGIFSMDGDMAPLGELASLAREKKTMLMVDDAHGIGVIGATGKGSLEHFGLDMDAAPILVGTFGKAFGTFGAFVSGSDALIELLIQKARPYIYTTALPPAIAHASCKALELIQQQPWRRNHLHHLVKYFRSLAKQAGLPIQKSDSPIQPLIIGDSKEAVQYAQHLKEQGILISAIRPPTVPQGTARLRITLSALHTETMVEQLIEALVRTASKKHTAVMQESVASLEN